MIFGAAAYASVEYAGLIDYAPQLVPPPSRLRIIKVAFECREFSVPRESRVFRVAATVREFEVEVSQ